MNRKDPQQGYLELPPSHVSETEYRAPFGSPGGGAGWGIDPLQMPDPSRHPKDLAGIELKKRHFHQGHAAFESHQLSQLEEEIATVKRNIVLPEHASALDKADHERAAIDTLLQRKQAEFQDTRRQAEDYFGETPLNKGFKEFIDTFNARYKDLPVEVRARSLDRWEASYKAALLADVQAKVVYRVMAESEHLHAVFREAHRVEHAKAVRAHEERLRVEHAQAVLAHEERLRVEHAQAVRVAEQEAAQQQALRLAREQAAEQEQQRLQREALVGAMNAVDPSSAIAGARLARPLLAAMVKSPPARAAALRATNALIKALESVRRSADELGNDLARQASQLLEQVRTTFQDFGEFFSTSLPACDVLPPGAPELTEIAAQDGSVHLPGWEHFLGHPVAGTLELPESPVTAVADVPVRNATFDERSKAWSVALPGNPGITLTWTPIASPIDSSTALPGIPLSEASYTGTPLSPVVPSILPLPAIPPGMQGLITVFPADSGLPPLFTVFNSPYPGATVKGVYSGRPYNPDKAGGPTLNLGWQDAVITQAGIALVKLHTGRLDYSAANDVMIGRLEKILAGALAMTDIDKRYYTHELRELERYRAIGVADGPVPDEIKDEVWNNAHTATLEDYQLKEGVAVFYTPEANAAHYDQIKKEYNGL